MADEDKPFLNTKTGEAMSATQAQTMFDAQDRKAARDGPWKAFVFSTGILASGFYFISHPIPMIDSTLWFGQIIIAGIGYGLSIIGFLERPKQ